MKVVITGGAGLVGQNLVARLVAKGYADLVVLDKHKSNVAILRQVQPSVTAIHADVSEMGSWHDHLHNADALVMLHAQIGGNDYGQFLRNNVEATRVVLSAAKQHGIGYLVHVSSSVVKSGAQDFYTTTKREQERAVLESGLPCTVLRPTLMFGWFDRKHFGWLSRFMRRVPIFPVPGDGRYMRQPLYAGDFCNIIISCLENRARGGVYNISGRERIDYIDIIREIRRVSRARTLIAKIPYGMFAALLWTWSLVDRNPPFTTQQLAALVAGDEFEVIDWPKIFGVTATPFSKAIEETFNDPRYSHVVLDF